MPEQKKTMDFNLSHSLSVEGRVPPQAMDVEAAVLSAMLLEKEAIAKAVEVLDDSAFYKPAHQSIYRAMLALFEKKRAGRSDYADRRAAQARRMEKIGGNIFLPN